MFKWVLDRRSDHVWCVSAKRYDRVLQLILGWLGGIWGFVGGFEKGKRTKKETLSGS
jgi:hypothetical protein